MKLFQYLALIAISLIIINILRKLKQSGKRRTSFFWLCLWTLSGIVMLFPFLTTQLAVSLGIERGADLVLYCAVLLSMLGFFKIYHHQRKQGQLITQLVRELAIQNPQLPKHQASHSQSSDSQM